MAHVRQKSRFETVALFGLVFGNGQRFFYILMGLRTHANTYYAVRHVFQLSEIGRLPFEPFVGVVAAT